VNYSFHPAARLEFIKAIDYYEECIAGLGSDFYDEIHSAINLIMRYPEAWSQLSDRTRKCLTYRFPYSIIYQMNNDEIRIISIAHTHRKPDYWRDRIESKSA